MIYVREGHTCTLLSDGRVFIAGGLNYIGNYGNTCEIYDVDTGQSVRAASMPPGILLHFSAIPLYG
jgi:hypothetical protein